MDNNQDNPQNNPQRGNGIPNPQRREQVINVSAHIQTLNRVVEKMLNRMAKSKNAIRENDQRQILTRNRAPFELKLPIYSTTWQETGPIVIRPPQGIQRKSVIVKTQTYYIHLSVLMLFFVVTMFSIAIYRCLMS